MIELDYVNIGLGIGSLIAVNYGAKLGRALPILKDLLYIIERQKAAKKDGKVTQKEKADLYDGIEILVKDAHSILKGLTCFKSK